MSDQDNSGTQQDQQQQQQQQQDWFNDFKDPEVKTWLTNYKGAYPNAEAVAQKAFHLERFVGADKAGRGIILPKDGAKPEEFMPIFRKLGAPETPDGYKVDEKLAKEPVMVKFREHAHKIGMPAAHFDATMQFFTDFAKSQATTSDAALDAQAERDMEELRNEWPGEKYDENIEAGRRAARTFLPHKDAEELKQTLHKLEGALGTKAMMKMWAAIGAGLSEEAFIDGDGAPSGGMTPEGARLRIAELKKDADWVKRYQAGGLEEKAEFEKLHKIASAGPRQ